MAELNAGLLASGRHDARSRVINALAVKWPLFAKQLHAVVSKDGGKPLTYQAVHKVLGELSADGVISRLPEGYSLSPGWVEAQKAWWNDASKRYSGGEPPRLLEIPPNSSVSYTFTGIISAPYWVIDEMPPIAAGKSVIVQHCGFAWAAQMVGEEQYKKMARFKKSKGNYALCRGNSPGDIYCLKYLEGPIALKWLAGVDVAEACDVLAFNDYVINIYWPPAFKKFMHLTFSSQSAASVMRVVYDYVLVGIGARMKVPVVITRNKAMAKQIIDETLAEFRRGRK